MKFDSSLLSTLACPVCKGELHLLSDETGDDPGLSCATCAVVYPVRDGIPDLLPESGRSEGDNA